MAAYQGKYKSVYNPGIEFETDYVAREAARDLMYHNQGPLTEYDLNDLPPAHVRPVKMGKWVKAAGPYFTPGGDPVWQCSECGKGRHVYGIEHGSYGADVSDGQWLACPNCMAIMEGESDDRFLGVVKDEFIDSERTIVELQKRVLLAPMERYAGLKRKYIVLKADTGEDVPDCFVLRPSKDRAAVEALRAYAKSTDNDLLAADIYQWVGPPPEPQKEDEP